MIYKILSESAWQDAERSGICHGNGDDARDGFIHFSAADQVAGTAAKHFAGQGDLVLVAVDESRLGAALKWEPSRGGALFPHLYGTLPLSAVVAVMPMPLGTNGLHCLPELKP